MSTADGEGAKPGDGAGDELAAGRFRCDVEQQSVGRCGRGRRGWCGRGFRTRSFPSVARIQQVRSSAAVRSWTWRANAPTARTVRYSSTTATVIAAVMATAGGTAARSARPRAGRRGRLDRRSCAPAAVTYSSGEDRPARIPRSPRCVTSCARGAEGSVPGETIQLKGDFSTAAAHGPSRG